MKGSGPYRRRSGAALVEGVITFGVLLTLALVTFDLGLAVFRWHLLAEAARVGARQAAVHGELADALGAWGPATVGPVPATDPHPAVQAVAPYLVGLDPQAVTVTVEWLDGGTGRGMRVRMSLSAPHALVGPSLTLRASSTVPIEH